MDSKIMELLIQGILETGEYTLNGIAYQTCIPFDVIFEAACGNSNQLTITPWARVVDLYTQVKPDTANVIINKLLEIKSRYKSETPRVIITGIRMDRNRKEMRAFLNYWQKRPNRQSHADFGFSFCCGAK